MADEGKVMETVSREEAVCPASASGGRMGDSSTGRGSKFIQVGDLVIIYMSRDKPPVPITVSAGQETSNAYGSFLHDSMIGLPYGAKLASRNARGFVHLLRPNPELWTLALPHRTQIIYTPDMSFITAHLGLTPGARVVEAGTGSGSFSHHLTRTVGRGHPESRGWGWKGKVAEGKASSHRNGRSGRGRGDMNGEGEGADESEEEQEVKEPMDQKEAEILELLGKEPDAEVDSRDGRVWSFEFHAGRAVKAWNEFNDHGLFPTLSLRHRNVCKSGFGLQGVADAVFLDLPAPWEALQFAAKVLRADVACRICCFSPCVEQVLKTVAALRVGGSASREGEEEARWVDIETYECLNRTHMSIWVGPGGQTANTSIEEAIERIRGVEERKGKRRDAQIERARREREKKNEVVVEKEVAGQEGEEDEGKEESAKAGDKRKREEEGPETSTERTGKGKGAALADVAPATAQTRDGKTLHRANVYARTFSEMRGHTSYLTFATLLPRVVRQEEDPTLEKEKEHERRRAAGLEKARQKRAQRKAGAKEGSDKGQQGQSQGEEAIGTH